jgi:hypothetical protein
MRSKNLAVALAVGLPLAAAAYVGWVYYSARVEFADRGPPIPPPDPNAPPQTLPVVMDPAELHGIWSARADVRGNHRESVLEFQPDGDLVWTTRATVGGAPPIETVERYKYTFDSGPTLLLTLRERTIDGKQVERRRDSLNLTFWALEWKSDDKTVFQLLARRDDPGLPHLLFRKALTAEKEWRLFGWDVTPPARR